MSSITELARYPISGMQPERLEALELTPGGPVGDRITVIYDSSKDPQTDKTLITQKPRNRLLAMFRPEVDFNNDRIVVSHPEGIHILPMVDDASDCLVNEYGTPVPAIDLGEEHAAWAAEITGNTYARLAQKTAEWRLGEGIPPSERAVAPLHFIFRESWDNMLAMITNTTDESIRPDRMRGNGTIEGLVDPLTELDLIGTSLMIGDSVEVAVHRPTLRCMMTGINQQTGFNHKDIPKVFKELPQWEANGEVDAVFGVYGYPVLSLGEIATICSLDQVRLQPR